METHADDASNRRPGRPRSARAHRAILDAALELFAGSGFEGMSIEAVAERAGVGKATIYRRWSSKEELVAEALESLRSDLRVPDTGNLRDDLGILLREAPHLMNTSAAGKSFPQLWVAITGATLNNPRFMEIYWKNYTAPRREVLARVLERAAARGEVRADLDADVVMDLIAGALIYRLLLNPTRVSMEDYLERVVDTVWRGIAAARPGGATG